MKAFVDAREDRRSTSGYCTMVWDNLVTWRSKKQTFMERRGAKAEFKVLLKAFVSNFGWRDSWKTLESLGYPQWNS